MSRRFLPAVLAVLAVAALPAVAAAGEPSMLGARLDTSGAWVAVISKATIPTHVELSTEGDVTLALTAFDMAPGERRQVAYSGSGLGYVTARMTPVSVDPGASSGALELRAWVRYVAPPVPPSWPLWWLLLIPLLVGVGLFVIPARRVLRHAS